MPRVVKSETFDTGTSNCFSEETVSAFVGHVEVRRTRRGRWKLTEDFKRALRERNVTFAVVFCARKVRNRASDSFGREAENRPWPHASLNRKQKCRCDNARYIGDLAIVGKCQAYAVYLILAIRRSLGGGSLGRRMSAVGFFEAQFHSRRAVVKTCEIKLRSRLTVEPSTVLRRISRHCPRMSGVISATR